MQNKKGFRLGRVYGIEIVVDYSWFGIFFLITLSFAISLLPTLVPGSSMIFYLIWGLIGSILFFVSVLFHELMHSIVSKNFGISVRRITLFLFGGISEITEEPGQPKVDYYIAIIGPFSSFALAGLFIGLSEILRGGLSHQLPLILFQTIAYLNLFLGIFNLLPGLPLDGGRIIRSILWSRNNNFIKSTKTASLLGQLIAGVLLLWAIAQIFFLNFLGGFWILLVALFMFYAAKSSYIQALVLKSLDNFKIEGLMRSIPTLEYETLKEIPTSLVGPAFIKIKNDGKVIFLDRYIDESMTDSQFRDINDFPRVDLGSKPSEILNAIAFPTNSVILISKDKNLVGIVELEKLEKEIRSGIRNNLKN